MPKPTDARVIGATLYLLPIQARMPIKFGAETVTEVTCARVRIEVIGCDGKKAIGWGETPLSVQWVWPSSLSYGQRLEALTDFCISLTEAWAGFESEGHPIEVGHAFHEEMLPALHNKTNEPRGQSEPMPWLAALVCCSAFDLALHDSYGCLHNQLTYNLYGSDYMNHDLSYFLDTPQGIYPSDFITQQPQQRLHAWHLVGGVDPLERCELVGDEPDDGHPLILSDWIDRDGLTCLKIKLRGNDEIWDYERIIRVGRIAVDHKVSWLSTDFNCTVTDPAYVNAILDRLRSDAPRIYGMLLYVEQPFPYDLESNRIDVHSVSANKPLFLDESAHDWKLVRLGRELGWSGVALKTCKTQTGAILSLCWAKTHGMPVMVQDLANPMLAMIPHAQLAAHANTLMGVETNGSQFFPDASEQEAAVHPGLYRRRSGMIDLSSLGRVGMGYNIEEIRRELPESTACFSSSTLLRQS